MLNDEFGNNLFFACELLQKLDHLGAVIIHDVVEHVQLFHDLRLAQVDFLIVVGIHNALLIANWDQINFVSIDRLLEQFHDKLDVLSGVLSEAGLDAIFNNSLEKRVQLFVRVVGAVDLDIPEVLVLAELGAVQLVDELALFQQDLNLSRGDVDVFDLQLPVQGALQLLFVSLPVVLFHKYHLLLELFVGNLLNTNLTHEVRGFLTESRRKDHYLAENLVGERRLTLF